MGVPGLWEVLRPAATRSSLSALCKTAFFANRNGLRALTIGVDASLWIFHAQCVPQGGENPFVRTIWFKICTLLQQPVLPVFVFDGPDKPGSKRGKSVSGAFGTSDGHSLQFKQILDNCGLEWWNAPGEAEAELAVMNRQGKIDAILSDDVDALLFGARCLLRNNSANLSGTSHTATSKGDMKTYEIYRSSDIASAWGDKQGSALQSEEDCRIAMIFVAMLAGGDYVPQGLDAFGPTIAFALANAGMSADLLLFLSSPAAFSAAVPALKERIMAELRTNSTGFVGRKYPSRADKVANLTSAELFNLPALQSYLRPATSPISNPAAGWPGFGKGVSIHAKRGMGRNGGRGDLEGMARACEKFFEWGTKELVVKRFASEGTGVFGAELVSAARSRRIEQDERTEAGPRNAGAGPSIQGRLTSDFGSTSAPSSSRLPSKSVSREPSPAHTIPTPSYLLQIERTRPDPTCPDLTEYRIQYDIKPFMARTQGAMDGHRPDPKDLSPEERAALGLVNAEVDDDGDEPSASQAKKKKADVAEKGTARVWIADWLVKEAWPGLVEQWDDKEAAKLAKLAAKGKGRTKTVKPARPKKSKGKGKEKAVSPGPAAIPAAAAAKAKPARKVMEDDDDAEDSRFMSTFIPATQSQRSRSPTALRSRARSPIPSRARPKSPIPLRRSPIARPRPKSPSRTKPLAAARPKIPPGEIITIDDSDEEVEEVIEQRRPATSLASAGPPRLAAASGRSKVVSRDRDLLVPPSRARTMTKSKSRSKSPVPATRPTKAGSHKEPIMIISSDEEVAAPPSPADSLELLVRPKRLTRKSIIPSSGPATPPDSLERPVRRPLKSPLTPSSRQNTSSPPVQSPTPLFASSSRVRSAMASTTSATAAGPSQMRLGMPIVGRSSRSHTPQKFPSDPMSPPPPSSPPPPPTSPAKSRSAARASPSPLPAPAGLKKGRVAAGKKSYVVLVDGGEEGGGVIDCTRGGRLLKDRRR